ncbi:Uncharacterized conserved protein, DUF885 familyt [Colwellia chukchiensis]|uniref:Uncharacterized conserved protein, DUF885 familyt n=1 Tax=Colwellia chukchiensis TaxID=641665 RepID=A0A1H7TNK0_9GAMM|nr:DUF885 domain-containing protein [Colwellia chukchiensis]SEL86341.1 Uncharacterized conserved protein, DUF885 familyt [Colwellia chukchiensis]
MQKYLLVALIALHISACGGSSNKDTAETPNVPTITLPVVDNYVLVDTTTLLADISTQLQVSNIDDFFATAYHITRLRDSDALISDGLFDEIDANDVQLSNISDAYNEQSKQVYQLILQQLNNFDRASLSQSQQISYDVYHADLTAKIQWINFKDYQYPASYGFFGWPGSTETFFTQAFTFSDLRQAEIYLTLLNQLARRFAQIEILLDSRKAAGIIEPAITLTFSQNAVANIANSAATATSYYQAFNNQVSAISSIAASDKANLRNKAELIISQKVIPAYQSLANKMLAIAEQAPSEIGFGQFAGGADFYNFTLNFYTSSTLSAAQIHQLGIDELARIHAEMRLLFDQLGYPANESLAQLYARVNSDAELIPANQVKSVYENLIANAYLELPTLFNTLPQQDVIVVGGTSGGYYIAGSDDGARPGAFYANTSQNSAYTTMPTLAYHEAVPGHHLQIALANELDLPLFRKKSHFTSFIEGWALYAERLAKDANWYANDVIGDLGRLQFEAMRAARLVVDTGIHSLGWSYNQADQFHIENVGFAGAISRYSVWPGQATAYMTGMLKILALREKAQTALGDAYDIKAFHDAVIGSGAMPLTVLTTVIDNYIADTLAAQPIDNN